MKRNLQQSIFLSREYDAFTLIEVLIVIGLIAILAAVLILAINPSQNFIDTRNATRQNEVNQIESAFNQWIVDGGNLTSVTQEGTAEALIHCAYGSNDIVAGSGVAGTIDVESLLVNGATSYMSEVPTDPQAQGADTGYDVCQDGSRVYVSAPLAEDGDTVVSPTAYTGTTSFNVDITVSGTDVDLSWDNTGATSYEVWRGTYAYFEPGDGFSSLRTTTGSIAYTDTGAAGNPATNYYYIIVAKDAQGELSATSNRVGEFDIAIAPGDPGDTRYNYIGIPLITSQFSDQSDVATAFGGSTIVDEVSKWEPVNQVFQTWYPSISDGDTFTLSLGDVFVILVDENANTNFTLYGDVPSRQQRTYTFYSGKYTHVILPLSRLDLTLADSFANSIGSINRVARWDSSIDTVVTRNVGSPFGTPNYSITPGYPYQLNSTQDQEWNGL